MSPLSHVFLDVFSQSVSFTARSSACFCSCLFFCFVFFNEITYLKKLESLNLGSFLLNQQQMMGLLNGDYFDLFCFLEISGYYVP